MFLTLRSFKALALDLLQDGEPLSRLRFWRLR